MITSHKNLLLISAACIAAISIAAAVKFGSDYSSQTAGKRDAGAPVPLSMDPSFYQKDAGKTPAARLVPPSPVVTAHAYLVGNVKTGQIYAERNGARPLPIASMSKLMTALVATNYISGSTTIPITPEEAAVYPDPSGIRVGETFTAVELMYPLLLDSSNIAAEALASSTDRTQFLDLMNGYAWEIGLPTSFFADPSGLSPRNEASAEGFFALARYVYGSRPDLLAITRIATISVATTTSHGSHDFVSIHPFISDPRFIGGKTGHTPEAGDTMLTILDLGGQPVAFIVLGSNDRRQDTALLIDQVAGALAKK